MKSVTLALLVTVITTSAAHARRQYHILSSLKQSNCALLASSPAGYTYAAYNDEPNYQNARLFRSSDGGQTWELSADAGWNRIQAITVTPGNEVFVGTYGTGLFHSTDDGSSWEEVIVETGYTDIMSVACDGAGDLFAGCGGFGGSPQKIFRSTDGGSFWFPISPLFDRMSLPALYADSTGLVIASRYHYSTGDSTGVYRSTDHGLTWSIVRPDWTRSLCAGTQGDIYSINYNAPAAGLSRSTDRGLSWVEINTSSVAGGIISLIPGPGGDLVTVTGEGLYRSTDTGSSWTKFSLEFRNRNLNSFSLDSAGVMLAGTRYDGAFRSVDSGVHWERTAYPGENDLVVPYIFVTGGADLWVAPSNGRLLYHSSDGGDTWEPSDDGMTYKRIRTLVRDPSTGTFYAGGTTGALYYSTDNGRSWNERSGGLGTKVVQALAINAVGDLFAGTYHGGVFRCTNGGNSWEPISNGMTWMNIRSLIALPNGDLLAGGGEVPLSAFASYRSTDNGENWHQVLDRPILAFARLESGKVFAAASGPRAVLVSTDNGENWTDPTGGSSPQAIPLISDGKMRLWAAYLNYLYTSPDEGVHWDRITPISGTPKIYSLGVDTSKFLYFGSLSGGLYKFDEPFLTAVDNPHGSVAPSFALFQNYPNPFNAGTVIRYHLARSGYVTITLFNQLGERVLFPLHEIQPAGDHSITLRPGDLPSGVYYYRLQSGGDTDTKKLLMMK